MVTMAELRDVKLHEFEEAAKGWAQVGDRASAAKQRVDSEMVKKLEGSQESESAKAAVRRLRRLSLNYQYIQTECGLIRTALDGLAAELATPQRNLKAALDEAQERKYTVHDDGSVSYPAAKPRGGAADEPEVDGGEVSGADGFFGRMTNDLPALADSNPHRYFAQQIADSISAAVRSATEIDSDYSKTLEKLKTTGGLTVTQATWADVSDDMRAVQKSADDYLEIPRHKSAPETKEWWDGLSEDEQQEYLALHPDAIGNLDGIPSDVRDKANRSYLPLLMGDLREKGDEDSLTKLDGLKGIQDKLDDSSHPPMYLLGVGDEGNGRAIVSYGNPDTSRNVSAYVPGLGTKLNGDFADGTVKRAQDTALQAQKYDPSSASIVWLGYDAPQGADVMSEGDGKRGAGAYNSFMSGISATNQKADPHVTALGHSYGSFTVGQAAQRPGGIPGADDIILVGSPGTGADNASGLGVGKEHVYVGAADNDLVTKLPSKEEGAGVLAGGILGGPLGAGAGYLIGDAMSDDDDRWFGTDPASGDFGANRFRVDDGPSPLNAENPMAAHSNYFTPSKDPESADNMGKIVAGHPELITREKPR